MSTLQVLSTLISPKKIKFFHRCNFHKKCAFAPRNNCAKAEAVPTTFLAGAGQFPLQGAGEGSQDMQQQQLHPQFQLPHSLLVHNYKMPTVCKICDKLLVGLVKQGLRCRDCKVGGKFWPKSQRIWKFVQVNVHKKCAHLLPSNCQITAENAVTPGLEQMSVCEQSNGQMVAMPQQQQQGHQPMDTSSDSMIPLARLPGSASNRSVRHVGQMGQIICEGWLIHFLLQERERRRLRHYWVLANGAISLFNEYNDGEGILFNIPIWMCYRRCESKPGVPANPSGGDNRANPIWGRFTGSQVSGFETVGGSSLFSFSCSFQFPFISFIFICNKLSSSYIHSQICASRIRDSHHPQFDLLYWREFGGPTARGNSAAVE